MMIYLGNFHKQAIKFFIPKKDKSYLQLCICKHYACTRTIVQISDPISLSFKLQSVLLEISRKEYN